ncbi:MAG: MarR family winged helix-turn-helix transcriptional regulator [Crocinitomicaceae bacterium]
MNDESDPDKPQDNLGFLLWQTNMTWQRELNRALDEIDITHTQFAILSALRSLLEESNAVTQKAIAERSNTDTMMISKVLRTLEKKGIVERKEHETDTRAKCVFLTSKGVKTFQNAFKIASAANQAFFSKLSDKNNFRKELQNIVQFYKIFKKSSI